jgi:hypothetical protein
MHLLLGDFKPFMGIQDNFYPMGNFDNSQRLIRGAKKNASI